MYAGVLDVPHCIDAFWDGVVGFSDHGSWNWIVARGAGDGH